MYNNVTGGPFIQTFKFVDVGVLFALLHEEKTASIMRSGVDQLETIIGSVLFRKHVQVLLTDYAEEKTIPKFYPAA